MWNKQSEAYAPPTSAPATPWRPSRSAPAASVPRTNSQPAHGLSCLGPGLEIKGTISGDEDLQIDGKVEGSIALKVQRLIIGHAGSLNSEVHARELIVYGNLTGNARAADRVEIKQSAYVSGDITTR